MTWDWKPAYDEGTALDFGAQLIDGTPVVPTGLPSIDSNLFYWGNREGIPRGEYIVVGGASNSGKTQAGIFLAKQAAAREELAAFVSLEMRRVDLLLRLYQSLVDIDPMEWMPKNWTPANAQVLAEAAKGWGFGNLIVNDKGSKFLHEILAEMRHLVDEGVTWFTVDHLQRVKVQGYSANDIVSRTEIAGEAFADFAFDNDVTVCCLSQLNAAAARDKTRSPDMYDLYGGTHVYGNASLCLICDHSRYQRVWDAPHRAMTFINFSKNRMGPKGFDVPVLWDHASLSLREALPDEVHEWPTHKKP